MKTTVYEDHWQGTSSKDIEYTTSDPALVEASISRLDGKSRTSVSMSRGEDMLCIGGGNDGRYMAYFAHNIDEALFNLIDPSAPEGGPELTIVTGGQAATCRPSSCLSLSIVTIAAVHFAETGERSPELQWIEG